MLHRELKLNVNKLNCTSNHPFLYRKNEENRTKSNVFLKKSKVSLSWLSYIRDKSNINRKESRQNEYKIHCRGRSHWHLTLERQQQWWMMAPRKFMK